MEDRKVRGKTRDLAEMSPFLIFYSDSLLFSDFNLKEDGSYATAKSI